MTNHAAIFLVVEVSRKWYDSLPTDLQEIVDRAAASEATAINPQLDELEKQAIKAGQITAANSSTCRPTSKRRCIKFLQASALTSRK